MQKEATLNRRMKDISEHAEIVEIILITIGIFLVPAILPQLLNIVFGAQSAIATNSQYIVGTIVNAALIVAGVNVKGWKKVVGLAIMPSMAAILSGMIFRSLSVFTIYMIPAIWLGNFTIMYLYRKLFVEKKINYVVASIVSISVKCSIIFAAFNLLTEINVIPKALEILFMAFGANQVVTATLGSIIAFATLKLVYQRNK